MGMRLSALSGGILNTGSLSNSLCRVIMRNASIDAVNSVITTFISMVQMSRTLVPSIDLPYLVLHVGERFSG